MNYQRVHDAIVARAVERHKPEGYCERHHIIPRSMGGGDEKTNLVWLTAREHYLIHWLLYLMTRTRAAAFAWHRMTHGKESVRRYKSHTYANARAARARAMSEMFKGKALSQQAREKLSNAKVGRTYEQMGRAESPLAGRVLTDAHKAAVSRSLLGRTHSDEAKARLSKSKRGALNPQFGREPSQETRNRIALSLRKACHARSAAVLIQIEGEEKTAAEWARHAICSVGASCITSRIRIGWDPVDAVLLPPLPRRKHSPEELLAMKRTYTQKLKQLKAAQTPVVGLNDAP